MLELKDIVNENIIQDSLKESIQERIKDLEEKVKEKKGLAIFGIRIELSILKKLAEKMGIQTEENENKNKEQDTKEETTNKHEQKEKVDEKTDKNLLYKDFIESIIKQRKIPDTEGNRYFLLARMRAEGGKAKNNPLNTTYYLPGSTDYNSVGVKNYASLQDGLIATYKTLVETGNGKYYQPIINALKSGIPTKKDAEKLVIQRQKKGGPLRVWVRGPNASAGDMRENEYVASVLKSMNTDDIV